MTMLARRYAAAAGALTCRVGAVLAACLFCLATLPAALAQGVAPAVTQRVTPAVVLPASALPALVPLPAGEFIAGSDAAERDAAYALDAAAYGSDITRSQGWYEAEAPRARHASGAYAITRTPVSNAQYAAFVRATGHRVPDVDRATWQAAGLIHDYAQTRRFAWRGGRAPAGREAHPVVLVSRSDAQAYAAWLSRVTGKHWTLPSAAQWERAARGDDGRRFPWGDEFAANRLNSADAGPGDTTPVGSFPAGASPYGVLDAAGQVYEWTADDMAPGRALVKGGGWDDRGCGVCRPAAQHARPVTLRHILIGFRLVQQDD